MIDTHVKYDKIIFVAQTGTCREQMAKGHHERLVLKVPMEIEARGLVVQFPEPVNQKAEAVLISNGISTEGMVSTQLEESDITESTMVFTMESSQRERIIESFADIDPEQVLCFRSMWAMSLRYLTLTVARFKATDCAMKASGLRLRSW